MYVSVVSYSQWFHVNLHWCVMWVRGLTHTQATHVKHFSSHFTWQQCDSSRNQPNWSFKKCDLTWNLKTRSGKSRAKRETGVLPCKGMGQRLLLAAFFHQGTFPQCRSSTTQNNKLWVSCETNCVRQGKRVCVCCTCTRKCVCCVWVFRVFPTSTFLCEVGWEGEWNSPLGNTQKTDR